MLNCLVFPAEGQEMRKFYFFGLWQVPAKLDSLQTRRLIVILTLLCSVRLEVFCAT